jgi:predicted glycosyltransferase
MRVWIDLTNSPHVLVMRPLIDAMRADGHEVEVTVRDFAQTLELCERLGVDHTAIGAHAGSRLGAKAAGLAGRSLALARWARHRRFDVALGHASNDVMVAAKLLRIPSATAFDYEWATVQHNVNCRLARAVVVPEAIPPERLDRYGARGKVRRYPGLKEEYYLADFEPDTAVLGELGLDPEKPIAVVRTPPDASLYHRHESPVFPRVLEHLRDRAQTVVLPRTPRQREEIAAIAAARPVAPATQGAASPAGVPPARAAAPPPEGTARLIVPDRAIDAQSLIAHADLVVSGGGTMNREAVALGTPVFTTFEGRPGAVDEALLRDGRLRRLEDPGSVDVEKRRESAGDRIRRDPRDLARMLLSAADR